MYTLHIYWKGDLFEVAMRDLTVIRISRYIEGGNRRHEVEWDELSPEVQHEIIEAVKERYAS